MQSVVRSPSPRAVSPACTPVHSRSLRDNPRKKQTVGLVIASSEVPTSSASVAGKEDVATPGTPSPSLSSLRTCVELQLSERFGSPQYPTPLDLVRGTADFSSPSRPCSAVSGGIDVEQDLAVDLQVDRVGARKISLSQFNSDSLHSFSFSTVKKRPTFISPANEGPISRTASGIASPVLLKDEFELGGFLPDKEDGPLFPTTSRNPNKALLTIDLRNSAVLVANDVACEMFGCAASEIIGVRFPDLLAHSLDRARQNDLIESNIDAEGKVVLVKGKVVDVVDRQGYIFPVSMWMKMLAAKPEPRCIAVLEPVARTSAVFALDREGTVVHTDETAKELFGFEPTEVIGLNITSIMPAFQLPDPEAKATADFAKSVVKQEVTGRLKSGHNCPLSVALRSKLDPPAGSSFPHGHEVFQHAQCALRVVVWCYANLSGLMTVREDGMIHSCNSTFSRRLFGLDECDLIEKEMSCVLPDLFNLLLAGESEGMTPACYDSDDSGDDVPLPPGLDDLDGEDGSGGGGGVFGVNTRPSSTSTPHSTSALARTMGGLSMATEGNSTQKTHGHSTNLQSIGPIRSASPEVSPVKGHGSASLPHSRLSHRGKPIRMSPLAASKSGVISPKPSYVRSTCSSLSASWRTTQEQWAAQVQLDASRIVGMSLPTRVRHRDGTSLATLVQVKPVMLDNGQSIFCIWIQRDASMEDDPLCGLDQSYLNISNSFFHIDVLKNGMGNDTLTTLDDNTPMLSCTASEHSQKSAHEPTIHRESDDDSGEDEVGELNGMSVSGGLQRATAAVSSFASAMSQSSMLDKSSTEMFAGDFEEQYITIKSIGKGAFGEVKLAVSRHTNCSVVVKFISKKSVLKESWRETTEDELNQINVKRSIATELYDLDRPNLLPLEIILLRKLEHPNIVKAIDVFENDQFFQMVMERHGDGMDLFEFIDYNPRLDEPLASYIFRQIAFAIDYLHSQGIVHRDVKDENVIIDDHFNVKLIDFGSAAYVQPGRLFPTFCGTLEFCSPEVLLGNQYPGPELEMWSLGVTLYTLVFGENPFVEADDIITGHLQPPFHVSPGLFKVLLWLLHPDPTSRCTVTQLLDSSWLKMEVDITNYRFDEVIGSESCTPGPAPINNGRSPKSAAKGAGVETSYSEVVVSDRRQDTGRSSSATNQSLATHITQ